MDGSILVILIQRIPKKRHIRR